MARTYAGDLICECGREVPAYKTGGGMLTTSCGWCRLQQHRGEGSSSYRNALAKLKTGLNPDEDATPIIKIIPVKAKVLEVGEKVKIAEIKAGEVVQEKTIFDIFK